MSKWIIPVLMSAGLVLTPPVAFAASGQKHPQATVSTTPDMVPMKHVYAQPVYPVIEPASKPVMTKNFAGPNFECRPSASDFDGGRCGY